MLGAQAIARMVVLAQSIEYLHDLECADKKATLGRLEKRAADIQIQKTICAEEWSGVKTRLGELSAMLEALVPGQEEVGSAFCCRVLRLANVLLFD